MAEKKATKSTESTPETTMQTCAVATYTVDEIAEAAGVFGATPDLVRAAFAVSGRSSATEEEAKKIINKFRKEVK